MEREMQSEMRRGHLRRSCQFRLRRRGGRFRCIQLTLDHCKFVSTPALQRARHLTISSCPVELHTSVRSGRTVQRTRTNVIIPFDASLELRQTKVDLDTEDNRPVRLAILALLGFCASTKGRQVRAYHAEGRVFLCKV